MQSTNSIFGNQELSDLNKQLWSEDFISILLLVHIFTVSLILFSYKMLWTKFSNLNLESEKYFLV